MEPKWDEATKMGSPERDESVGAHESMEPTGVDDIDGQAERPSKRERTSQFSWKRLGSLREDVTVGGSLIRCLL
jgi:hypothetical protein